ncbi:hypothetical protein ACA910_001638 [Epithemia clementina (nom. ined.)]
MDELLALFEENPPEESIKSGEHDNIGRNERIDKKSAQHDDNNNGDDDDDDEIDKILGRSSVGNGGDKAIQRGECTDSMSGGGVADMESRLGIRIVERQMSSLDLMDLMNNNNNGGLFVSTAALAAMSLKQLNRYLVEPAAVLDAAAVCGRTMLTTVGVVFEASKTRMTSNGNAFCKLGVGTLRTGGPCLTVLLFGAAYSAISNLNHNKKNNQNSQGTSQGSPRCGPGTVVAILNPRLMPNSSNHHSKGDGSDTALTVSLNDPQQLVLVGRDGDFGQCQARVSSRNEQGHWVSNARQCGNFIDQRQGPYCVKHRSLKHVVSSSSSSSSSSSTFAKNGLQCVSATAKRNTKCTSLLQQMRQQPSQMAAVTTATSRAMMGGNTFLQRGDRKIIFPGGGGGGGIAASSTGPVTTSLLSQSNMTMTRTAIATAKTPIVTPPNRTQPLQQQQQSTNMLLASKPKTLLTNPYKTSSGGSIFLGQPSSQPQQNVFTSHNPSREAILTQPPTKRNQANAAVQSSSSKPVNLHTLLLQRQGTAPASASTGNHNGSTATKKRTPLAGAASRSNGKRRRSAASINTDTTGFDGSVAIPKPSRLFRPSQPQHHQCHHAAAQHEEQQHQSQIASAKPDPRDERLAAQILLRQAQVAERLMGSEQDQGKTKRSLAPSGTNRKSTQQQASTTKQDSTNGLFGSITQADLDRAATCTSVFASEVQAEEYALHRRAVVELEKEEQRKMGPNNDKNNDKDNSGRDRGIQIEWHCRDCAKTFRHKLPSSCRRQNHNVVRKRIVAQPTESVDQRRQNLNDRSNLYGNGDALTLGSGLEWSTWGSRFS